MNSITNLSPKQLRQAADLKEKIDALQEQFNQLLGAPAETQAAGAAATKKGKFSPAAIARIRAAQKARWAKVKAAQPKAAAPEQKPKRKFTAAGRRSLSLAAKARWAKAKAEGRSRL